MKRHPLIALGLAVALAGGCAPAPAPADRPLLRIASDATFAPFHYMGDDGRPTGFDIELARLAAEHAGFAPQITVRPYDDLLSGLTGGDHDVVAATTGITPERQAQYLFTRPYFETSQAVLVRAEPDAPGTLEALRGRRVGAAGEGTSLRALQALYDVERVALGKGQAGVPALEGGAIDALVVDEFDAVAAARSSDGRLRVLAEPAAVEQYAFVLARGRDDLKRRLDDALRMLDEEGRSAELRARFGVTRDGAWPVRIRPDQP